MSIPSGNRELPTVAFETLGCKLNQYETDAIATALRDRGYRIVPFGDGADAYVINSCTVTNKADRKSRNILFRAQRMASGVAVPVIFTGCFVDSHPTFDGTPAATSTAHTAATAGGQHNATYFVRNTHKNTIPELLEAHFRGETLDPHSLKPDVFGFSTPDRIFHTRTNIKVQDGCDNYCTFCIIPFVRGRARSRSRADILQEAQRAVAAGSRELILTGVNMSRYRDSNANDAHGGDFVDLVQAILDLPGDFRLRISSLEPDGLDDRFVQLFEHPRMCPHLHLCLQSGSDRILLRMRRMYTRAAYRDLAEKLRARDARFNLTTDLITGFPGETEPDVALSVAAIHEHRFGHVHVFPFSVRAGTRAERMPDGIPAQEKRHRSEELHRVAVEEKRRYRTSLVGTTATVLVEKVEASRTGSEGSGLSEYYVPVRFFAPAGTRIKPNRCYQVEITGIDAGGDDPRLTGVWRRPAAPS